MACFGLLESMLNDQLGFTQTPHAAVTRRLRGFLNQAHHELLAKKALAPLRRALLTCSSVANDPFMVLPQAAARVLMIADRTNLVPLALLDLTDLRVADPGVTAVSGVPAGYVVYHLNSPIALDPSDASALYAKSSSGSDAAGPYVFLEGIITGGYPRSASVALTGTTAVQVGSTISTWERVTKFYVGTVTGAASVPVGFITLHEDSGSGTELARIPIGKSAARYTRLHLYPTPTASLTYYVDVVVSVAELANYQDETLIPEDFTQILICGALIREFQRMEKPLEMAQEQKRWKELYADLVAWVQAGSGSLPAALGQTSQLGAYYPPGS